MRTPRIAAVATLLTLTSFLAACGGDDKDGDSSDDKTTATVTASPSETTSAPTETTPTETAPVTPMDPTEAGDVTQEQVNAALLVPEEVGADFVLGAYTDSDDPPLCDPSGAPLDEQVPPQVQGGTEIDHSSGDAALQEEITIYATEADAANAFAIGTAGITCTDGTTADGTSVTIDAPQDVTAQVNTSGIGTSTQWGVTGGGLQASLIVTLAGRVILVTSFTATSDFDTSTLPNPVDVANAAFAKALAN